MWAWPPDGSGSERKENYCNHPIGCVSIGFLGNLVRILSIYPLNCTFNPPESKVWCDTKANCGDIEFLGFGRPRASTMPGTGSPEALPLLGASWAGMWRDLGGIEPR